jgi:hypothetical protein
MQKLGEQRTTCRIFVGKPDDKRQLGRPRYSGRMILKYPR